ncbi:MAG TPA: 4-amino-4-deoxy-L-arabinose transferase [Paenibacillus sp.]|nr:4-amino-4-deoxy-L-arabinose transferase [Paenibacillus sp.]
MNVIKCEFGLNYKKILMGIIFVAFVARILVLLNYGYGLSLNSDDMGYWKSAINLISSGKLTYHDPNELTTHIMPGMPILLASIILIFGKGSIGMTAAKIFMILCGVLSVFMVALIAKCLTRNEYVSLLSAFSLALYIPQLVTDNLLLTESPYTASLLLMVYYSLVLAEKKKIKHLILLTVFYLISVYLRPAVALYPLVFAVYFLLKKYPVKMLLKHGGIAAIIIIVFLAPWWIRNYVEFNKFIPLSSGVGNPLLLGSFQGVGYPDTISLDDTINDIEQHNKITSWYERFELQEKVAKQRLVEWYDKNPMDFLYSHIVLKPKIMWDYAFYWIPIFDIKSNLVHTSHLIILLCSSVGIIYSMLRNKENKLEVFYLFASILYFTYVYSMFFAFNRYNITLMPFVFIGFSIFIYKVYSFLCSFIRKLSGGII